MKYGTFLGACLMLAACTNVGGGRGLVADSDITMMESTLQLALDGNPDGQDRWWHNAMTGHYGSIAPIASYVTEHGVFCRDYRDTQTVGGRETVYTSRACRTDDSSWIWVEDIAAPRQS